MITIMTRDEANRFLYALMHAALAADSLSGHGFRPVKSAVFIRTTGKSVREIVDEAVPVLCKAGLLKTSSQPVDRSASASNAAAHEDRQLEFRFARRS